MEAKDYLILDDARTMAIGKILNAEEDEEFYKIGDYEFMKLNGTIKANYDLLGKPVVEIEKDGQFWCKIDKKLFENGMKIINSFRRVPNIALQSNPNTPILMFGGDLGIVIAPKIVNDTEETEEEAEDE